MRAVAVIPVILHHANLGWIGGGYAGVDVFFVISGYLIASIIFFEKSLGSFTLAGFYERRARRILPALFLVTLACIPPALLWMTKIQLEEFFDSVAAVAVFASNFLFWDQTGYFGVDAETKPLLHTWSLAVEEQFYVLFPLLTIALWKLPRRFFVAALIFLALASLALSHYLSLVEPSANFYWSPTRMWELLLGVLLAVAERKAPPWRRVGAVAAEGLGLLGLAAIIASFVVFDRSTPFPGFPALLPTMGTVLVLAFARENTLAGRLLGLSPLVGIGLISYSAYLWHQPLFAFARLRSLNEPGLALYTALIAVTLAMAYLSWRFVEQPFRDRYRISSRHIFAAAAFSGSLLLVGGLAGRFSNVADPVTRFDFSAAELATVAPANGNDAVKECQWERPLPALPRVRSCRFGAANAASTIVLLGDSHAEALFSALNAKFSQDGIAGILLRNRYCGAFVGIYEKGRANGKYHQACAKAHQAMLGYVRDLQVDGVVLAIRWSFQLYPVAGEIDALEFDNREGGAGNEHERIYYAFDDRKPVTDGAAKAALLRAFVDSLLDLKAPLFLVYPVPEVGWRIADYNFKHLIAGRAVPGSISIDHGLFIARNRFAIRQLDAIERPNLVRIKPAALLCDTYIASRCVAQFDSKPFYNDDDHLSDLGAALVVGQIAREFRQQRAR